MRSGRAVESLAGLVFSLCCSSVLQLALLASLTRGFRNLFSRYQAHSHSILQIASRNSFTATRVDLKCARFSLLYVAGNSKLDALGGVDDFLQRAKELRERNQSLRRIRP